MEGSGQRGSGQQRQGGAMLGLGHGQPWPRLDLASQSTGSSSARTALAAAAASATASLVVSLAEEEMVVEEQRGRHGQSHDGVGRGRPAPGVAVHRRPREGRRRQVAGGAGARHVHRPERDHLLVPVHVVVLGHGEAPRNRRPFLHACRVIDHSICSR